MCALGTGTGKGRHHAPHPSAMSLGARARWRRSGEQGAIRETFNVL